jgi:hypothetical protein
VCAVCVCVCGEEVKVVPRLPCPQSRTYLACFPYPSPAVERFITVSSIIEMGFYNNFARSVWGKSNANYLTYIVAGCIGLEFFYGSFVNYVWEKNNKGVSG